MNKDEAEAEGRRQVAELLTAVLPGLDEAAAEGDEDAAEVARRAREWLAEQ